VAGFSKSEDGTLIPLAEVSIFKSETDAREQKTTSDAYAAYSFNLSGDSSLNPRARCNERWWIRAYSGTGSTAKFGTTLRTIEADEQKAQ
jgi:hypothetical protein